MKVLPFCITMFLCFTVNAYDEQSHHAQEYFAKTGVSGYVSSDEKETQPRTPLEVYELSSYRHRRQEPQKPQQYTTPVYNNYQPQPYNTQQLQATTPQRGIFTKTAMQNVQPNSVQQYASQPPRQSDERGIFGSGKNSTQMQQPSSVQQQSHNNMQQPQVTAPQRGILQTPMQNIQSERSVTGSEMKSNISTLFNYSRYYAMNFAHPFKSSIKFSDADSSSTKTDTNNSFLPIVNKNGSIGFYVGHRMQKWRAIRYEYGVQWELLSFDHEASSQKYNSFLHNAGLSLRSFFDIPLSHSAFFSIGLEGNYGVISKIAGDDQYFSGGFSYAFLTGITMQLSKTRSLYVLLRQGAIPNKGYKVLNTTRNASFSSTSIMVGLQLLSM